MTRLVITASQFRAVVEPVRRLACTDAMLPIISAVRVRTAGGHLTAEATDRFRAGISRIFLNAEKTPPPFDVVIPIGEVKRVLALFRATRRHDPALVLTARAGRLTIRTDNLGEGDALRMSFKLVDVADVAGNKGFPDIAKLITGALERQPVAEPMAVNPRYLADFAFAIREQGEPLVTHAAGESKPLLITCGDHFLGLLMPMKAGADAPTVAALARTWSQVSPHDEAKSA